MDFPIYEIGIINGIDFEYEVHWVEQDLAQVTIDGVVYTSFCSVNSGGFLGQEDVLDQAQDVVLELETDWGDSEW